MTNEPFDDFVVQAAIEAFCGPKVAADFLDLRAVECDPFWTENAIPMPRHRELWIALGVRAGLTSDQAQQLNRFQLLEQFKNSFVNLPALIERACLRKGVGYRVARLLLDGPLSIEELCEAVYQSHDLRYSMEESIRKVVERMNQQILDLDPRVRIGSDGTHYQWLFRGVPYTMPGW
jgi:hypothetical protein